MAACRGSSSKWFYTREQLESTPSRRCGVEPDRELSYRQQAANLIQDMGQRLNVSQLTINTAIVYMHRFYMHHSFTKFHRNIISPTTLFLAAKVEEQPRKLEHVIKVAHACLNPQEPPLDTKSNAYLQQAQELVILESIVLQTLGFEITIDHPHTDVVKCSQLVRASKDLAQTSYFMATNSLHLTTFCLQHKPTVISCVCIHLACKWSNWEIPVSTDGKHWWEYVDTSVTLELLDELTHEFLQILEKTPSRLKRIRNWRATQAAKKPKTDGSQLMDNSFPGPSILQDQHDATLPGVSSNSSFSKTGTTFTMSMPGQSRDAALTLDTMAGIYNPASHSEWPLGKQSQAGYLSTCIKQEPLNIPLDHALSLQTSTSSLLQNPPTFKTEKMVDFNPIKQEPKGAGMSKHQPPPQSAYPPSAQPSPAQRLSLDKYREKHAVEMSVSGQKRRQEQHGGALDCDVRGEMSSSSTYAPSSVSHVDHRKHLQPNQLSFGGAGTTTVSPVKIKVPSSSSLVQDRCHHSDKRDKSMPKLRLALPGGSQLDKGGPLGKDELKMKIKVSSSECHSSSDESMAATNNSKSKSSSLLVSKEKHRGAEHHLHRHHKHTHPHAHSGNGRGGPESQGGGGGLLRGTPGSVSMEGSMHAHPGSTSLSSSTSRKRQYPEVSHNHHPPSSSTTCSKVSKTSKGGTGAAGGLRTSQQYPPSESPHEVGEQRH
ncbi:cyclin-T2 isoform X2 [Solea senegalensis]|uniref:Cyclin-T2 isoform X2 n=2 Tax=Solea senegalensis TaxID=28829 RepID=A0AAV6R971_SOLSE|nr:cyclin-T2a isoform X2 [Solea senegalensis]KAG7501959.1 cyclin-T2 isoform X2 [Solea senegalensis]